MKTISAMSVSPFLFILLANNYIPYRHSICGKPYPKLRERALLNHILSVQRTLINPLLVPRYAPLREMHTRMPIQVTLPIGNIRLSQKIAPQCTCCIYDSDNQILLYQVPLSRSDWFCQKSAFLQVSQTLPSGNTVHVY